MKLCFTTPVNLMPALCTEPQRSTSSSNNTELDSKNIRQIIRTAAFPIMVLELKLLQNLSLSSNRKTHQYTKSLAKGKSDVAIFNL